MATGRINQIAHVEQQSSTGSGGSTARVQTPRLRAPNRVSRFVSHVSLRRSTLQTRARRPSDNQRRSRSGRRVYYTIRDRESRSRGEQSPSGNKTRDNTRRLTTDPRENASRRQVHRLAVARFAHRGQLPTTAPEKPQPAVAPSPRSEKPQPAVAPRPRSEKPQPAVAPHPRSVSHHRAGEAPTGSRAASAGSSSTFFPRAPDTCLFFPFSHSPSQKPTARARR